MGRFFFGVKLHMKTVKVGARGENFYNPITTGLSESILEKKE